MFCTNPIVYELYLVHCLRWWAAFPGWWHRQPASAQSRAAGLLQFWFGAACQWWASRFLLAVSQDGANSCLLAPRNVHRVRPMTFGRRLVLAMWFTCSRRHRVLCRVCWFNSCLSIDNRSIETAVVLEASWDYLRTPDDYTYFDHDDDDHHGGDDDDHDISGWWWWWWWWW